MNSITESASQSRLLKLREALVERELEGLLVTHAENVRYLSGFTGSNGTLLIDAENAVLLTDFRYTEQAADQSPEFEIVDGGSAPRKVLAERFTGLSKVGFDEADMRVKSHRALLEELPEGTSLVEAAGIPEALRAVKDDDEIDAIARAAAVADSIYATLADDGLVGRSEVDVAWRIEWLARERGASGLSFPPIVAAGAHGALPHAEPRDRKIQEGELVVLDLGVVVDGYCSDCTRTFATGRVNAEQREVYEVVRRAQEAALAAVVAGADCASVDSVAREIINAAGHGERFGHSTGHGVGIEVHEQPTLSTRSEQKLVAGNVVTVEPGIYVPGEFGVRIEDLAVVAEDGAKVLTPFTKELLIVD